MAQYWIATGALWCALSVIAGAFGAHGLEARLDVKSLALWETAARYFMFSGLGIVLIGLAALSEARRGFDAAAACLGNFDGWFITTRRNTSTQQLKVLQRRNKWR